MTHQLAPMAPMLKFKHMIHIFKDFNYYEDSAALIATWFFSHL